MLLHHLQARGHRIVLAHPERSPALQRDPGKLAALVDAGMLCSITAGSLVGRFGSTVQRFTFDLVQEGLVHNVASDAHDARRRPPGMAEEITQADADLPGLAIRRSGCASRCRGRSSTAARSRRRRARRPSGADGAASVV